MRIAIKRAGRQGQDGFFDITCFERTAANCARYLKSGRAIAVDGRLQFEEFETAAGEKVKRVAVVADRIDFLASPLAPEPDVAAERPRDRRVSQTDDAAGARADESLTLDDEPIPLGAEPDDIPF
jgi:single-strand DNA-binding protein